MKPEAAAALLLLVLPICAAWGQAEPAAQQDVEAPPESADPAPVLVSLPEQRIECRLPAPYWSHYQRDDLLERAPGGCMGQRVPPNVVFVLNHKDAPASAWCERLPQSFLMRDKDDLENFVSGFIEATQQQARGTVLSADTAYPEPQQDGVIVHRYDLTMRASAGGGCAAPGAAAQAPEPMRYVFVHYLVHPQDADAVAFKLICAAPTDVFEALQPELESIIASVRYTGQVAAEFFVPDAPEDKVLTARDAARAVGGGGSRFNWFLPVALMLAIWFMFRRKKQQPAT